MATFQAVGLNLAVGSGVLAATLVAFSVAVHWEFNDHLAPRTWARPREVLKNVLPAPWYGIAWIPWTLSLSYKQLLDGIPGTGTRNKGWSGNLLKCNLDGIIVIKFHALCLKLAIFATVLCLVIILPINFTAECDPAISGADICKNITALSNFEKSTLANIPPMDFSDARPDDGQRRFSASYIKESLERYFWTSPGTTWRLFVIVIVTWAIFIYSCSLIWNEWIDNLALRRVFFLEHDHYQERKDELDHLMNLEDPELEFQKERQPFIPHPEVRDTVPNISLYSVIFKLPDHFYSTATMPSASILDRQLAATASFFDKCVPNQPGYSSSVAAVTILPDSSQVAQAWRRWYACARKLRRLRFIRMRTRQLQRMHEHPQDDNVQPATDVENPPLVDEESRKPDSHGYHRDFNFTDASRIDDGESQRIPDLEEGDRTSSVADASKHSPVSAVASEEEQHHANKEVEQDKLILTSDQADVESVAAAAAAATASFESSLGSPETFVPFENSPQGSIISGISAEVDRASDGSSLNQANDARGLSSRQMSAAKWIPSVLTAMDDDTVENAVYKQWQKARSSPQEKIGLSEEAKLDMFLSEDGMEQLSVYCREFAESSAGCCIYGCDYSRLLHSDLDALHDLEEEAEERVHEANEALIEARAYVNKASVEHQNTDPDGKIVHRRRSMELRDFIDSSNMQPNQNTLGNENASHRSEVSERHHSLSSERRWKIAGEIAKENRQYNAPKGKLVRQQTMASGTWRFDIVGSHVQRLGDMVEHMSSGNRHQSSKESAVVNSVMDHHTYAVVTFTSRQAAIAARQCMADGSGLGRWEESNDLPIPPLADSPPCDLCLCRGCCRPVTLTINDSEKRCRMNITWLFLGLFCCLYTIPLSLTSNLLSPNQVASWFPTLEENEVLSGILIGLLYTVFFSICPFIFKALANFGSGATSQPSAELSAIKYYWIFILLTAFTGSSLATMLTNGLYNELNLGASAQEVLRRVAKAIPTQISATWLNWIVVRFLFTVPTLYLFQGNTFLFSIFCMDCCSRCVRGGGSGGPMPFRIFVDSGTVFLCIVALAPACPCMAPAGMLYFLTMTPVLRWLLIFVYRPIHDGGGQRWPLLHEILISSMIVAQVLLTTMMVLKKAYGPAFLAALSIIPTFVFSQVAKEKFLRCFNEAGLIQTSSLDGWDVSIPTSDNEREEFRKWLVDCHKASYIPICLAGMDNFLTAEPAVVISSGIDDASSVQKLSEGFDTGLAGTNRRRAHTQDSTFAQRARSNSAESTFILQPYSSQKGALFRRCPRSKRKYNVQGSPSSHMTTSSGKK